jgi:hypothetical protein
VITQWPSERESVRGDKCVYAWIIESCQISSTCQYQSISNVFNKLSKCKSLRCKARVGARKSWITDFTIYEWAKRGCHTLWLQNKLQNELLSSAVKRCVFRLRISGKQNNEVYMWVNRRGTSSAQAINQQSTHALSLWLNEYQFSSVRHVCASNQINETLHSLLL